VPPDGRLQLVDLGEHGPGTPRWWSRPRCPCRRVGARDGRRARARPGPSAGFGGPGGAAGGGGFRGRGGLRQRVSLGDRSLTTGAADGGRSRPRAAASASGGRVWRRLSSRSVQSLKLGHVVAELVAGAAAERAGDLDEGGDRRAVGRLRGVGGDARGGVLEQPAQGGAAALEAGDGGEHAVPVALEQQVDRGEADGEALEAARAVHAEGHVAGDEQVLRDLLKDLRAELGDAGPADGLAGRCALLVDLDAQLLVALVAGRVLARGLGGGDRGREGLGFLHDDFGDRHGENLTPGYPRTSRGDRAARG
jgi:hypothetical protein